MKTLVQLLKNSLPALLIPVVIWSIVFPTLGFGQHYYFKNYFVEDGLAHSDIFTLFQDSKGFLWIGYYGGGLDRFDGKRFSNFTVKDGLSNDTVYAIIEDREGNLWIGTDDGLCKYDGRTFTSYTQKNGLLHPRIRSICLDRNGHLWLTAHTQGVSRFDSTRSHFKHFTTADGLIDNDARIIKEDSKGNIWIGTVKGVSQYNGTAFVQSLVSQRLANVKVTSIFEDSSGNLWFGTTEGAGYFDHKTFTLYTTKEGLSHNEVNNILEDSKGCIWFATFSGLSRFDGRIFTNYTTKNGLCYDNVEELWEDREGNLWIGTQKGITKYKGGAFTYFSKEDGLKDNIVWAIWQDHEGPIWIGTEKGIAKFYGEHTPIVTETMGNLNKEIFFIYKDRKGNLWFSSEKKVLKYDGKTFVNMNQKFGISQGDFLCILEDKNGDIWIGTREKGVIKYDGKTALFFTKKDGLLENNAAAIVEDPRGNLWFATSDGISIYNMNAKRFTSITPAVGLCHKDIVSMIQDEGNNIWIGTYGGGINMLTFPYSSSQQLKKGDFAVFTSDDGLLDDHIVSLVFDNTGYLWVGTNKGISALDVNEFKRTGRKAFKNYGKEDELRGIECNQNAVYKDKEGNIWFGTIKGAIKYNPGADRPNTVEPSTYITGLKLFLEEVDWAAYSNDSGLNEQTDFGLPGDLELPYTKNHLTFEYIGISLASPERVRYRTLLHGFDKNWSPVTKATYVTYSNLSPGDYVFKVEACNNSGIWNKEPAVYRFRISSPFWQRWWFYFVCFIVVFGAFIGFIRMHTQRLQKQKLILEKHIHLRTLELEKEKLKVEVINRELEERVEERTQELDLLNKQLFHSQKMEAVGTLAAGVAQDLNTILDDIIHHQEHLLTKLPEDSSLKESILAVQKSGKKAADILQDMLILGRRGIISRDVVNLNNVVSEFMKSPELEKLMSHHPNVRIETKPDEHLQTMMGSAAHLAKALMNLISNGIKALPGGGTIVITTTNQCIFQPVSGDDVAPRDYVVLAVSDTGSSISPQDLERIFEPFYTKKKMERHGTGLEMAVVWATVKDHNGYITAHSEEGKGTTFTLYFPAARQKTGDDT
jgi:two-component system sensor histidine kinase ChiS